MADRYVAEIQLSDIERVQLYINARKKTLATIKSETGADYALNGGLYDMNTFIPCVATKADGIVYGTAPWREQGYAWDRTGIPAFQWIPAEMENYLAGNCLIENGKAVTRINYDVAQGGRRGRSAMGRKGQSLVLYCSRDGSASAKTPEGLRDELAGLGLSDAIMLDSGGSSQCDFKGNKITSTRKVQNLILVYLKKTACPYPEPAYTVRKGTRGDGARWVQWQLNRHGASLVVDGIFGGMSHAALVAFQRDAGLVADGLCGPLTRAALKK